MYGMCIIIFISIGFMCYSVLKFVIINFISVMVWVSIIIILVWYLGEELLYVLGWFKKYFYVLILLLVFFLVLVLWYF